MHNVAIIIILLFIVTCLAEITDKIRIPHPILLVLAGIGIGLFPGLPHIALNPEVVFLIFLPPILYAAAWTTSWADFKKAKRPITLLATGCVVFTTCAIAWIAQLFIPGFGWKEGFVLGAIISPPDAIAAAAATKGLKVPKRITTVLEGESLVNDATGLIVYRYAVAAILSGTFHLIDAGLQFVIVATGGILLGFATGFIFKWIHRVTPNNPTTDTTFTFLSPYIAYLTAEALHVSGVLAVVTAGLYLSYNSSTLFTQQTRLQANSTWDTILFILNGVIFILIGLQLPVVLEGMQHEHSFLTLIKYGAIISLAVIVGRIIWVYPGAYIPRLSKAVREREPQISVRVVTIVAWSGMRGVVSLAAALALPLTVANTTPFPNRDMIIFLTFCVIFSTLIIQGLTLRPLIKFLGIRVDGTEQEKEQQARLKVASAVIEHIEENYSLALSAETLSQIKNKYEIRIYRIRKDLIDRKYSDDQINEFQRIQKELLALERQLVLDMWEKEVIADEIFRKIEYELDLEETRLILDK